MSQPQGTPFKHSRSLENYKCEIRLLRLKPCLLLNDPLEGTIEYVSLNDNPVYKALSYVWRGAVNDGAIARATPVLYIHNQVINITRNLSAALRYLAVSSKADFVLWVDAISIDQSDDVEKSWQIGQMRRVYSQASWTIIWLGPPSRSSSRAIELLASHRRHALKTQAYNVPGMSMLPPLPPAESEQENRDRWNAASFGTLFEKEISSDTPIPPYPIDVIDELLRREWWRRVWVLQELVSTKHGRIAFVCGRDWIDTEAEHVFGTFLSTWDQLQKELGRQPAQLHHRPWFMIYSRLDFTGSNSNPKSLAKLLRDAYAASLEATDPKDHIYALLGLASDAADLNIDVNCSPTYEYQNVYIELIKKYLERGDLWFLPFCQWNSRARDSLPSWVPNWSTPASQRLVPLSQKWCVEVAIAMRELNQGIPTFSINVVTNQQYVHLNAVLIDSVEWVAPIRPTVLQSEMEDFAIRGAVIS